MNEETPELKKEEEYKPNSILDGLPAYLKEPKNYVKIEKSIIETLSCGKVHSDPIEMQNCAKCKVNMLERRALIEKLGFRSIAQFYAWRKVHQEIKKRVPLDKYNHMIKHE